MGKPLIMGRKTYESIGRPLPGRETIVVTRDPVFTARRARRALLERRRLHAGASGEMGAAEIIVAGGGEIYRAVAAIADASGYHRGRSEPAGDAIFPRDRSGEMGVNSREPSARARNDHSAFSVVATSRADKAQPR